MNKVYAVVFKENGKEYYFSSQEKIYNITDYVIVETEKGLQYGKIIKEIENDNNNDYKNIIRKASKKDYNQYLNNLKEANKAKIKAQNLSDKLNLKMKFLDSTFTFDRNQLLFNFYADERVDFRELAKKLAAIYKTRIEFRQLGARDRAASCSGIGICGKKICCASFLHKMDTVSINMAKNQNISLNPNKINGICGRLLCCLTYEDDEYVCCKKGLPKVGEEVEISEKKGKVKSVDILNRKYKVEFDGQLEEIKLD